MKIALVGTANSGKSTIFNLLTQGNSYVGNFPGATVTLKKGQFKHQGQLQDIEDLPGIYNISQESQSLDEFVAREAILNSNYDLLIQVLDASRFSSQLYLTLQLMELSIPLVLVVNKIDKVTLPKNFKETLEQTFSLNVFLVSTQQKQQAKKTVLEAIDHAKVVGFEKPYPQKIQVLLEAAKKQGMNPEEALSDAANKYPEKPPIAQSNKESHHASWVRSLMIRSFKDIPIPHPEKSTHILDKIFLHPLMGPLFFVLFLYIIIRLTFSLGGLVSDWIGDISHAIFVNALFSELTLLKVPYFLKIILAKGVGSSFETVLSWGPLPFFLFFFIALMEESGYITRIAYLLNRFASHLGLSGRSMIPLLLGIGCTVSSVLSTRTLPTPKERAITSLMSSFVSCSAKLPVYAVFSFMFFPKLGGIVMLSLYLLGLFIAFGTALLGRFLFGKSHASPLLMELPSYELPSLKRALRTASSKTWVFIKRAAVLIIIIATFVVSIQSLKIQGQTILEWVIHPIMPIFFFMGITKEGWPLVASLIPGALAKEIILGALNAFYQLPEHHLVQTFPEIWRTLLSDLSSANEAFLSNLVGIFHKTGTTSLGGAIPKSTQDALVGTSPKAILSFLIFVLIYPPCVATISSLRQEFGNIWTLLSVTYSTLLAYSVATIFYQSTQIFQNLSLSLSVIALILSFWICLVLLARSWIQHQGEEKALQKILPMSRLLSKKKSICSASCTRN